MARATSERDQNSVINVEWRTVVCVAFNLFVVYLHFGRLFQHHHPYYRLQFGNRSLTCLEWAMHRMGVTVFMTPSHVRRILLSASDSPQQRDGRTTCYVASKRMSPNVSSLPAEYLQNRQNQWKYEHVGIAAQTANAGTKKKE